VQVVDKKENSASAIERDGRAFIASAGRLAARGCQLRFFATNSGAHLLEEGNVARFAVDLQSELIASQAVNKTTRFVEHRYIRLDQRGFNANDVFAWFGLFGS
jgi:hypothetical protein